MKGNKPGSPMRLKGRHEVFEKRFGDNQNTVRASRGRELVEEINPIREGSRDSVLMDLSQDGA